MCSQNHPYNLQQRPFFYNSDISLSYFYIQPSTQSLAKIVLPPLTLFCSPKHEQGQQWSQSMILYRSGSENWYIAGSNLWEKCLLSEWQSLQSILSHTLNLLPWPSYPTNTIKRPHMTLKVICLAVTLFIISFKWQLQMKIRWWDAPLVM